MHYLIAAGIIIYLGYLLIVKVIIPLFVYVFVPVIILFALAGILIGGYTAVYNYLASFKDNIRTETFS